MGGGHGERTAVQQELDVGLLAASGGEGEEGAALGVRHVDVGARLHEQRRTLLAVGAHRVPERRACIVAKATRRNR
tara:strand:+ start:451 stop:678 length:228 start_codon:yes stop_codon:yes gene_type:complete